VPQRLEGLERLAVLILRLFLGFAFMMHGSQKLLGAFGGGGVAGVAGMLSKLGLEPSQILAWVLSITEFVGGVCVFLGFLTRFWAALVIDMAVAIFKVHMANGFFASKNGFELPLAFG
jgi:putative oxidoreductase